jgi:hypothetical protein
MDLRTQPSGRTHRPVRGLTRKAALAACLCLAVLLGIPGTVSAASTEVPLTDLYNNYGIAQTPTSNANFDGGGYAYSAVLLQHGDPVGGYPGITGGQTITMDGFSFTWPNRPGLADNVEARGQTITVPAVAGATKLGLLAASVQGTSSGAFTFAYSTTDAAGQTQLVNVTQTLSFTDWTRGLLGDAPLAPNNKVVTKALTRHFNQDVIPIPTQPHVFLVTANLNPAMTLQSIKLPLSAQIHVFGMALQ